MKHLLEKEENTAPGEAAAPAQGAAELPEDLPYFPSADALKFWLMPFVCFLCFGLPTGYGRVAAILSGFAPLCFFILCGFFALTGEEYERAGLLKSILRTAIMFLIMFSVCLVLNILYYIINGAKVGALFSELISRRVLFNVFVLCAWPFPMGESIWFIQSLLYAYIILYLMNLLRLRRLRWVLLALCAVLMLASGELAGVVSIRFRVLPYLPPNALTRALPYMLLGGLLREKMEVLREKKAWVYLLMVPLGLALAYGEFVLLGWLGLLVTTDHAVGLGLTAFGLCAWVLFYLDMEPNYFCVNGRLFSKIIYLSSQPVAFLLIVPMSEFFPAGAFIVQLLGGLIVYPVCLLVAVLINHSIHDMSPI